MTISERKQEVRTKQITVNRSISADILEQSSRMIFRNLYILPVFQNCHSVFSYVSCYGEISTFPILRYLLKTGKKVTVPKCISPGIMEARVIQSLDDLKPGKFGILEPPDDSEILVSPELCLLPCIACTADGIRLGHGGGYYDRYLAKHPEMHRVILAGSWQILDALPYEPFDIRCEYIVSEIIQGGFHP